MLPLANTARWDTHCGAAYLCIYSFRIATSRRLGFLLATPPAPASLPITPRPGRRAPMTRCFSCSPDQAAPVLGRLPFSNGWSMSEAILTAGQATADNLPAHLSQIQYIWRVPHRVAEQVSRALDNNAEAAAKGQPLPLRRKTWVVKSRPGLA